MAKFGHGRMPHLGSEYPDASGLELMAEWIYSLGKRPHAGPPQTTKGVEEALRATHTALPFARAMPWWESKQDERKVLAAAAKLPPGPVRDLFEGYLPPDPKGRKIGSNPRPASILGLKGDAANGEKLFFAETLQCAKCHKIGDRGTSLGPELTAIGKTRSKEELLESVLEPSRRVEPKYASFLVKTIDGRSFTGLLVKRDDTQVILRDAENKEIVLAAADVEAVQPSRLSLMPDGQVAGLRPQEAADLIEFLASRR
jgi:putative heme-binding domain-containing protein